MQEVREGTAKMISAKLFNEINKIEKAKNIICYSIFEKRTKIFNLKFKTENNLLIGVNDFQEEKDNLSLEFEKSLEVQKIYAKDRK